MDSNSLISRAGSAVSSEVDGQVVIMSIESGHFFQLNPTGSRIWDLLGAPIEYSSLRDQLVAKFKVDEATCEADLNEFIEMMRTKGLLAVS